MLSPRADKMADVFLLRLKKNYETILRDLEPRQVLNYLYQEDVIDTDLRDEIRAKNTRKRQAEILLDCIRRRGPEAVQYFIQGLQNSSQKHLAEILKKPIPNESAGMSLTHGGDNNCYPMNQSPSGLAVIINNDLFDDATKLEYRKGSEKDVLKMKNLFERLDFIVEIKRNRTAIEMNNDVRALALEDHTKYDCCVLFFMSHGSEEGIFGTDGKPIRTEEITAWFTVKYCPTLANKPKLFFVQACRGQEHDAGYVVSENPGETCTLPTQERSINESLADPNASESRLISHAIPNNSDIYFAFASSHQREAYRDPDTGAWFVNQLYEVMTRYASQEDLISMMVRVTGSVAKLNGVSKEQDVKQCPEQRIQLRKKLFFRLSI